MTLKGYKISSGGGIQTGGAGTDAILAAMQDQDVLKFGNGTVQIGEAKAQVTFAENTGDSGSTTFNFFDREGNAQAVGFTNEDGGTINVSSSSDDYILLGNYHDDKDVGSTLTGGKGNDTLLGGAGDVLNAGGGKDNLILFDADDTSRDGAEVVISSGYTTVRGTHDGYDEDGDVINVDLDKAGVSSDGQNIFVEGTGVHATIESVENGKFLLKNGSKTYKAWIASGEDEIAVSSEDEEIANYYQGSSIDFSNYDDTVSVNLSDNDAFASAIEGEEAVFSGFSTLKAGSGKTLFMGGSGKETLIAGTGEATLYGGDGRNVLANSGEEKEGNTSFFVLSAANGARNTIQGFEFLEVGDDDNSDTADVVEIGTKDGNYVSNVFIRNDDDVSIEVSNRAGTSSETAVIEDAVGKDFKVSQYIAQVNTKEMYYDGSANFFVATEKNASLVVGGGVDTTAVVWLGNQSGSVFIGDIRTIDATDAVVRAELAGNDLDNTILGGLDNASLWGGNGGDDSLVGGSGQNMFFYTNGNGSDTISGTNEGDVVYLSAVTLENLAGTDFNGSAITLNFKDGGKLTVNDASNCAFVMGGTENQDTYYVNGEDFTTTKPE